MREKEVEKYFVAKVRNLGGLALKFVSPGFSGVPDRIVLLPGGFISFVELKAPGKEPRPLQVRRKKKLEDLGFRVYIVDSKEKADMVLKMMEVASHAYNS